MSLWVCIQYYLQPPPPNTTRNCFLKNLINNIFRYTQRDTLKSVKLEFTKGKHFFVVNDPLEKLNKVYTS